MGQVYSIATAFVLTVILECGLACLFRDKQLVYPVFLCNMLTNPAMNIILQLYYQFISQNHLWLVILVMEISVTVTEAFLLYKMTSYSLKKSALLSLLLNSVSCGVGLLFFY